MAEALEAAGEATGPRAIDAGTGASPAHHPCEHIEQLANHALRGELWDKAARYLRRAGARAVAQSALHDARTWFAGALGALAALPESRPTLEEAYALRLAVRPVLAQLGEFRQALAVLREAETIAERLGDDHRRGQVYAFLTNVHARLDELDAAVASGERALQIAERLGG